MRSNRTLFLSVLVLAGLLSLGLLAGPSVVGVFAAAPTPGPGAMTVYQVWNPNDAALVTTHTFYRELTPIPVWSFVSTVPISGTSKYYTRWYTQLVSPFTGTVRIEAALPFTAEVVGYEYPPTSTPTVTPTRTATPTPAATVVLPVQR